MLLCYIYKHFAWSIKLGSVILRGEKCQLAGMVTTDAEKWRAGVLMIGSKSRDAVLMIGEMQSRRREMPFLWSAQRREMPFLWLARCNLEEERWLPATFGFAAGSEILSLILVIASWLLDWIRFVKKVKPFEYYFQSCWIKTKISVDILWFYFLFPNLNSKSEAEAIWLPHVASQ